MMATGMGMLIEAATRPGAEARLISSWGRKEAARLTTRR